MGDDTDELVEQWAKAVPQIDPQVERIVDRLLISARYLDRLAASVSAPHDLQLADYEIVARLYWVGPPHRLRPSQLAAGTLAPATSVTSRLDRLEKRGLIERIADPSDRRVLAAGLTSAGCAQFEQIVAEQAKVERALFDQLSAADRQALDAGLRALMAVLDERLGPAPRRVNLALAQQG